MRTCTSILLCLLLLELIGCGEQAPSVAPAKSNSAAERAASEAAGAWLELVDAGSFGESWREAAALFQAAVSEADWEKTAQAGRTPFGKMVSRKVKSQQYATSLPGAPDGEYVVIQYDTAFENKASAVETVTPMLDKDGKWRVSGYYIK
jgi:hypothetical protein